MCVWGGVRANHGGAPEKTRKPRTRVHLLQHFEDGAGEGFNAAAAARLLPGLLGGLATLFAVAEEEGRKGDG